ncbi:MAG TPA: glycosyltransferase family 4 protein, partial [Microlunatus sp.]|nr:glycosyltransferase family 4 protein [Microlunatus sp.]
MSSTGLRGLRVALAADGPPTDQRTNSGVARGMLEALRAHPAVESVVPIDAGFRGARKALVALHAIMPSQAEWRLKYSQGRGAVRMRSRIVTKRLQRIQTDIDIVLLIRGLYEPLPYPYVNFIDSTVGLAQIAWPPWAPTRRRSASWSLAADRAQLRAAEHVFTAGRHVAEHVIADYGVAEDRVSAIGGGLNFPIDGLPPWEPSQPPTILFVGHDFERKGGDVLIEAFHRVRQAIPTAHLVLVGRGVPMRTGDAAITSLGEVTDRHELSELYRRATALCLPARFEPYGLVLLEAMAHGLPCIGTRVGAIPEILQDGELGLLVDAGDTRGLADALVLLLQDLAMQQRLSTQGRVEVAANGTWVA